MAKRKLVSVSNNCYLDITVRYKKKEMLSAYVMIQQHNSMNSKEDKIYVSLGAIPALIAALKEVSDEN